MVKVQSFKQTIICLSVSITSFFLQESAAAGDICQLDSPGIFIVPSSPIGTTSPFRLSYNSQTYVSGNAGPVQQQCCSSGTISFWVIAMNDLGYTGSLSATCSDGTDLEEIRYGYNGTGSSTCDWGLQESKNISNPANNTYSYSSGLILDSFLDGKDSVACSSGSEPIGFLAAPSCFALTSFQVVCKDSNFSSDAFKCSQTAQTSPSTALGGLSPFALVSTASNGSQIYSFSSHAGPQQTQCCQGGQIEEWTLRKGIQNGYVGEISAECTDGSDLPSVRLGYNGTGAPPCNQSLQEGYNITTPLNGNFTYKSGAILDSLLGENDTNSFSCEQGKVPVGFAASSSCFAVTNFQVVCDIPTLGSSNATLGASALSQADNNS